MSGSTRVFLPGNTGHDHVRGSAAAPRGGGELVLVAAGSSDVVHGETEDLPLYVLEQRRASAGEDVTLAVVEVTGQAPALALRAASAPAAAAATPVRWAHTSLAVDDLDTALRFYREAFGFDLRFEERGMTDQIRGMTGIAEVTCDLAQLSSPISSHVLELIAFRGVPAARASWAPTAAGRAHVAFSAWRT